MIHLNCLGQKPKGEEFPSSPKHGRHKETVSDIQTHPRPVHQLVDINLTNVSAKPSFVNSGSPVEITAVLGENVKPIGKSY